MCDYSHGQLYSHRKWKRIIYLSTVPHTQQESRTDEFVNILTSHFWSSLWCRNTVLFCNSLRIEEIFPSFSSSSFFYCNSLLHILFWRYFHFSFPFREAFFPSQKLFLRSVCSCFVALCYLSIAYLRSYSFSLTYFF